MDQAKDKLKILLIHRPGTAGNESPWARCAKALGSFTELQTIESDALLQGDPGEHLLANFQHIFLDYTLVDWQFLAHSPSLPLSLIAMDPINLEKDGVRFLLGEKLSHRSCLNIADQSATDLARLLHLYLIPKRVAGVLPLLEKGSIILGEKIQSAEGIGTSLDKLATYLEQTETFRLKARLPDLRQVLSAVLLEAYRLAKETDANYPTIDFQVGVSAQKLVVNLRFRNLSLSLKDLSKRTLDGIDFFWQQAWLCADISFYTEHAMHKELEAMFVFNKPQRDPTNVFHSLILKRLEKSGKRENLLAKPQDFTFQFLSDVRLKQHDVTNVTTSADEISSDLDLGTLPEPVIIKLKSMHEAQTFAQDQLSKREAELRDASSKLSTLDLELTQKKSEIFRLTKVAQVQSDTSGKRIKDLERRVQNLTTQQKVEREAAEKENKQESPGAEGVHKLEASIRVLEGEKSQMLEKFGLEQKRYGALEAKYSALYKDLTNKDKEINELKTLSLKLKKEAEKFEGGSAAKIAAASAAPEAAKLKELEMREQALKQELKKMLFKVENNEKNVKAIQAEAAEKAKLLEQKLQAAKAKELDLLKKVDELTALVKKMNKAA